MMSSDSTTFGDVIETDGRQLVFLVSTLDTVYLAIIPDEKHSLRFSKKRNEVFTDSKRAAVEQNKTIWCFIELTTEEFRNRIAFYALRNSDCKIEDLVAAAKIGTLNNADKKALHKEIIGDDAVTRELRDKVSKIVLDA